MTVRGLSDPIFTLGGSIEIVASEVVARLPPPSDVTICRGPVCVDPISGEELQALAEKIFATPMAIVEQAKQALIYKPR